MLNLAEVAKAAGPLTRAFCVPTIRRHCQSHYNYVIPTPKLAIPTPNPQHPASTVSRSLDIVGSVFWRVDPLPAGGEALLLERVRPVGGLGVVVDVVVSAVPGVVHGPARRQRQLQTCGEGGHQIQYSQMGRHQSNVYSDRNLKKHAKT